MKDFEITEYRPLLDEVKELIHKKQYEGNVARTRGNCEKVEDI